MERHPSGVDMCMACNQIESTNRKQMNKTQLDLRSVVEVNHEFVIFNEEYSKVIKSNSMQLLNGVKLVSEAK